MRKKPKKSDLFGVGVHIESFYKRVTKSKDDIVHFVSFPKSGRTWLELILAKIYADLTGINEERFLGSNKVLIREKVKPYPFLKVSHGNSNSRISQGEAFPIEYYKGSKVILMVRDPRDVVVSHYYHEKYHYKCFDGNISQFLRYAYDKRKPDPGRRKARFGILSILNYMNAWQENLGVLDDSFLLTYEDMQVNSFLELTKICKFIGLPVEDSLLNSVIEACSFENMRKLEESNKMNWNGLESSDTKLGLKTRKGKAGGYKEELSDDDIAYLDKMILENRDKAYSRYIL